MSLLVDPEVLLSHDSSYEISFPARSEITGKTILVTGAGGSIGSEIVRQCIQLGAKRVIKVDNSENAIFQLSHNLFDRAVFAEVDDLHLVDITNFSSFNRLVGETKPDVIFHAAAQKHLALLEDYPENAVRVNVFGTLNVIESAVQHEVPKVVNISTDKAADPESVLGWSKRLAELICAANSTVSTKVTSVRFGNVLGSNGSLLYSVQANLQKGLAIPITDLDVTRYFMTIPEATGLVIEALRMSVGEDLFVLDMGNPVRIVEIVNKFAQEAGFPEPEIDVIGLRPGEKIHESLFSFDETYVKTAHQRIYKTNVAHGDFDIDQKLDQLGGLMLKQSSAETFRSALVLEDVRKVESLELDDDSVSASSNLVGSR